MDPEAEPRKVLLPSPSEFQTWAIAETRMRKPRLSEEKQHPSNRDRTSDLEMICYPLQSHALPTELSKAL